MAYRTFIARAADGFPLVEAHGEAGFGGAAVHGARHQAQQLLTSLHSMPPRCSIHVSGGFVCHLRMVNGICYMGVFCQNYPRNAAFAFLEDIVTRFQEELMCEFGNCSVDYRSHVDTIVKPYYFARFDRQIARIYSQFRDPTGSLVLNRLQNDLAQVSHIMQCSFEELTSRGESLDSVSGKASQLNHASAEYKLMAKSLSTAKLHKYLGALLLLLLLFTSVYIAMQNNFAALVVGCLAVVATLLAARCISGRRKLSHAKMAANLLSFAGEYGDHLHLL